MRRPIEAKEGGVQLSVAEAFPVGDGEDVGGHALGDAGL